MINENNRIELYLPKTSQRGLYADLADCSMITIPSGTSIDLVQINSDITFNCPKSNNGGINLHQVRYTIY